MAKRIKISIQDSDTNINLPALPIGFIIFGLKCAKGTINRKLKEADVKISYKNIMDIAYALKKELNNLDPFVLVEVENKDEHILIEVK